MITRHGDALRCAVLRRTGPCPARRRRPRPRGAAAGRAGATAPQRGAGGRRLSGPVCRPGLPPSLPRGLSAPCRRWLPPHGGGGGKAWVSGGAASRSPVVPPRAESPPHRGCWLGQALLGCSQRALLWNLSITHPSPALPFQWETCGRTPPHTPVFLQVVPPAAGEAPGLPLLPSLPPPWTGPSPATAAPYHLLPFNIRSDPIPP